MHCEGCGRWAGSIAGRASWRSMDRHAAARHAPRSRRGCPGRGACTCRCFNARLLPCWVQRSLSLCALRTRRRKNRQTTHARAFRRRCRRSQVLVSECLKPRMASKVVTAAPAGGRPRAFSRAPDPVLPCQWQCARCAGAGTRERNPRTIKVAGSYIRYSIGILPLLAFSQTQRDHNSHT